MKILSSKLTSLLVSVIVIGTLLGCEAESSKVESNLTQDKTIQEKTFTIKEKVENTEDQIYVSDVASEVQEALCLEIVAITDGENTEELDESILYQIVKKYDTNINETKDQEAIDWLLNLSENLNDVVMCNKIAVDFLNELAGVKVYNYMTVSYNNYNVNNACPWHNKDPYSEGVLIGKSLYNQGYSNEEIYDVCRDADEFTCDECINKMIEGAKVGIGEMMDSALYEDIYICQGCGQEKVNEDSWCACWSTKAIDTKCENCGYIYDGYNLENCPNCGKS